MLPQKGLGGYLQEEFGASMVEYALLLMMVAVTGVVLLTFGESMMNMMERAVCNMNAAMISASKMENDSWSARTLMCPSGGVYTFSDGHVFCSVHQAPSNDDDDGVPFLWKVTLPYGRISRLSPGKAMAINPNSCAMLRHTRIVLRSSDWMKSTT